jgi:hypothetical protein
MEMQQVPDRRCLINRELNYSSEAKHKTKFSVSRTVKMDDKIVCKHREEHCPALKVNWKNGISQERANIKHHKAKYFHYQSFCSSALHVISDWVLTLHLYQCFRLVHLCVGMQTANSLTYSHVS